MDQGVLAFILASPWFLCTGKEEQALLARDVYKNNTGLLAS